jgi:PAS domain S-box-containing protein
MLATGIAKQYLDTALNALKDPEGWRAVLDELPVPIYTTDSTGAVTYWNDSCVKLVGREPRAGEDRWCVTWKLYTTSGDRLPHDECPMARAIREKREIHNDIIIAERPNGQRVACRPYPTPFFDEEGNLEGAVNMIIELTTEQAAELTEQAARCRRLAKATTDTRTADILDSMARDYASTAAMLKPAV